MLGKHHLSITTGFFIPILVFGVYELINGSVEYFYYSICILLFASIGSLLPDADSEGKATLYYRYRLIYYLMTLIHEIIILLFNNHKIKEKLKIGYTIEKRHRGILHTPIGAFLSSLLLTAIFSIAYVSIAIYLNINVDLLIILSVFLGLFFGQIMHLVEDSFTVSGINWLFPFGNKTINGKIYTFEKVEGKVDIRPDLYAWFYQITGAILLVVVIFYSNYLPSSMIFEIIGLGVVLNLMALIGMYFISNTNMNIWLVDKRKWRKIRKTSNKLIKNFEKTNKSRRKGF